MRLYITPNNICLLWEHKHLHKYNDILMRYMNVVIDIDDMNDIIKNKYIVYGIPDFTEFITYDKFKSIIINHNDFKEVFMNKIIK